jgi:protein-disulfide isomerase
VKVGGVAPARNEGTVEAQLQKLISVVSTLIALQVVTLATVVGVSWYSHKDLKQELANVASAGGQRRPPEPVENWRPFIREHNAAQGREEAAVVVVEFSDFQCPYCKKYSDETRRRIAEEYGDRVRMVFKHYPLEQIHPHAMTAAIAAQCAHREGRFWEVHGRLFSQPNALDLDSVIAIGKSAGLSNRYAECVANGETKAEVEQDIRDGMEVGVQGTPTLMINGQFLTGAQPVAALESVFEKAGLDTN